MNELVSASALAEEEDEFSPTVSDTFCLKGTRRERNQVSDENNQKKCRKPLNDQGRKVKANDALNVWSSFTLTQ